VKQDMADAQNWMPAKYGQKNLNANSSSYWSEAEYNKQLVQSRTVDGLLR